MQKAIDDFIPANRAIGRPPVSTASVETPTGPSSSAVDAGRPQLAPAHEIAPVAPGLWEDSNTAPTRANALLQVGVGLLVTVGLLVAVAGIATLALSNHDGRTGASAAQAHDAVTRHALKAPGGGTGGTAHDATVPVAPPVGHPQVGVPGDASQAGGATHAVPELVRRPAAQPPAAQQAPAAAPVAAPTAAPPEMSPSTINTSVQAEAAGIAVAGEVTADEPADEPPGDAAIGRHDDPAPREPVPATPEDPADEPELVVRVGGIVVEADAPIGFGVVAGG